MNENMNTFDEIKDTEEVAVEVCESLEETSNGIAGKLAVGAVLVGLGVAAVLYKTRDWREARKIEKLRKKGYVIYMPEPEVEDAEQDVYELEEETE